MDLINATGESCAWKCDGRLYRFPPGELGRVSDEVGNHLLIHLKRKGLQEVRYGDDPAKVGIKAVAAIVKFHRGQIAEYDRINAEQEQQKLGLLKEPEGVRVAKARLKAYEPAYARMIEDADEVEAAEMTKAVELSLDRAPTIPDMEDMDIDELRNTLVKFGGRPGRMSSRSSLLKAIKRQVAEREEAV